MTSACQLSRNDSVEAETDAGFIQREVAKISIHSARVGGDLGGIDYTWHRYISIHSARVGGDSVITILLEAPPHFNPLRPCGRRRNLHACPSYCSRFQSTPPVWAETLQSIKGTINQRNFNPLRPCGRRHYLSTFGGVLFYISIHSARVGGDHNAPLSWRRYSSNFNPLRPCGRRLGGFIPFMMIKGFQSTPPVWAET